MLAKLKYWGQHFYFLRHLCTMGLFTCAVTFIFLLFSTDHTMDKWLLPSASAFGWFACLYALLNFALLLPDKSQGGWWQRFKYRFKALFAWLVIIVFCLLSLTLLFISFRAIRLFFG